MKRLLTVVSCLLLLTACGGSGNALPWKRADDIQKSIIQQAYGKCGEKNYIVSFLDEAGVKYMIAASEPDLGMISRWVAIRFGETQPEYVWQGRFDVQGGNAGRPEVTSQGPWDDVKHADLCGLLYPTET